VDPLFTLVLFYCFVFDPELIFDVESLPCWKDFDYSVYGLRYL